MYRDIHSDIPSFLVSDDGCRFLHSPCDQVILFSILVLSSIRVSFCSHDGPNVLVPIMSKRESGDLEYLEKLKEKNKDRFDKAEPCAKERKISLDCLDLHDYDHSKCQLAFENFRICKQFWNKIYRERAEKGIRPFFPPPEEREVIQREHIERQRLAAKKLREQFESSNKP